MYFRIRQRQVRIGLLSQRKHDEGSWTLGILYISPTSWEPALSHHVI